MRTATRIASTAAALAMVAAPAAGAKPDGSHGHGGENAGGKGVMYVFKGTYVDSATVDVAKGNHHVVAAGLLGPVSFDFSGAKVVVGDVNGDGSADLGDVAADDAVVVKVKAPRSDPGEQPFAARQLVDQTHSADAD
ncbi:MAG: hypothetical protein ACJ75R_07710 [Solirubrobacterales bacterium]